MAAREDAKSRPSKASSRKSIQSPTIDVQALESRVEDAESECQRLIAELAAAQSRIELLEAKHAQAVNQIDWVLDSLHNLVEDNN